MSEALNDLAAYLGEKLGDRIEHSAVSYGDLSITVPASSIVDVVSFLKREIGRAHV